MDSDPTSGDAGQETDEQTTKTRTDGYGVETTSVGKVAGASGLVERPDLLDTPMFDVGATHYDDEPGVVELEVELADLQMEVSLSSTQARALAIQIGEAAKFADEGELPEERQR